MVQVRERLLQWVLDCYLSRESKKTGNSWHIYGTLSLSLSLSLSHTHTHTHTYTHTYTHTFTHIHTHIHTHTHTQTHTHTYTHTYTHTHTHTYSHIHTQIETLSLSHPNIYLSSIHKLSLSPLSTLSISLLSLSHTPRQRFIEYVESALDSYTKDGGVRPKNWFCPAI